jgi:hypothetical protein
MQATARAGMGESDLRLTLVYLMKNNILG